MINLCNTLLVIYKVHAVPAGIGKTIKPKPVFDKVKEIDVAPMITILYTDSSFVSRDLKNFISFLDYGFLFKVCDHLFNVVNTVIKIIYVNYFFSYRCCKSIFFLMVRMGIIKLFFAPFKWYTIKHIFRDISLFLC